MGRTRTKGIHVDRAGHRHLDKIYKGERIFERLGAVSQDEAETRLRSAIARLDAQRTRASGDRIVWADGAARYLNESAHKRTADRLADHVALLLPHIGALPVDRVHDGTLAAFIDQRKREGAGPTTINRSLEVARTVLIRCARSYRDDAGRPWLVGMPPLITMLPEHPREPHPLTWAETDALLAQCPPHLAAMVEFALHTGAREANVIGLQWAWEQAVPEIGRSVFVVPAAHFKSARAHVLVLNDRAWQIVQAQRGRHPSHVFSYHAAGTARAVRQRINNTAWKHARDRAGLHQMRVHDLRHTFGARLRAAGVPDEDRAALLGHAGRGMPQHYGPADIERLLHMANRVLERTATRTVLRVVQGGRSVEVTQPVTQPDRARAVKAG